MPIVENWVGLVTDESLNNRARQSERVFNWQKGNVCIYIAEGRDLGVERENE